MVRTSSFCCLLFFFFGWVDGEWPLLGLNVEFWGACRSRNFNSSPFLSTIVSSLNRVCVWFLFGCSWRCSRSRTAWASCPRRRSSRSWSTSTRRRRRRRKTMPIGWIRRANKQTKKTLRNLGKRSCVLCFFIYLFIETEHFLEKKKVIWGKFLSERCAWGWSHTFHPFVLWEDWRRNRPLMVNYFFFQTNHVWKKIIFWRWIALRLGSRNISHHWKTTKRVLSYIEQGWGNI